MFVICPLSNCAGVEKRDRFLEFISQIAVVTQEKEPGCQAYAWFRNAGDSDAVPGPWLRGLEIYGDVQDNTITHRASAAYKAFRLAVGKEKLLERPSDLRFWRPTGTGFLTRVGPVHFAPTVAPRVSQYVVVDELTVMPGIKFAAMGELQKMVQLAKEAPGVGSFWILDRGPDEESNDLYVFSRFDSRSAWEEFETPEAKGIWLALGASCDWRRRTTWLDSGIGFIGR